MSPVANTTHRGRLRVLVWISALLAIPLGIWLLRTRGVPRAPGSFEALTPGPRQGEPIDVGPNSSVGGNEIELPPRPGDRHDPAATPGLHGTVSTPKGPVAGAVVFVHVGGGEAGSTPRRPLASTETAEDGSYELNVQTGAPLDLGVVAIGLLPHTTPDLVVDPGGTRHDVTLEEGLALAGRVIDTHGAPVSGMPLLAHPAGVKLEHASASLVAARAREYRLGSSGYHDGRATTDARGYFRVAGLRAGQYVLRTSAPEWVLDSARHEVGGVPSEVRASRCVALELRVLGTDSEAPLHAAAATVQLHLISASGSERSFGPFIARGHGGALSWTMQPAFIARMGRATDLATVTFSGEVRSPGYEPHAFRTEPVSAIAGKAQLTLRLRLQ